MLAAIANAMRALASALAAVGRWCWWAIDWTIGLPALMLGGGSAGSVPYPAYEPPAGDPAAEIAELVDSGGRARAVRGALPSDLEPSVNGSDPIAATVHAYARATPSVRNRVSVAALSPDQLAWLLRQTEDDLQRMASPGGLVCGRLARGVAGGTLGMTPCRRREREMNDVDLAERGPEAAPARLDYAPGHADRAGGIGRDCAGRRRSLG